MGVPERRHDCQGETVYAGNSLLAHSGISVNLSND